ncbi:MAG: response regulator [Deltaproteobacteria bacterium]|nr:response regulator [Deltaproteobacteria bacterium]
MRVLIVEDSDAICRMIEALVAARGYEVRSASNGARGIEEALAWKPHVMLLDINLPGSFDGLDVCAKLRDDAQAKDIPIIIISALNDDEVKRRAMAAGATAYYEKPFSPLALLKEIEGLARRSEVMKI